MAVPSRYELLDRIAVGGMAEVYRARAFGAHGFEKTLAIKKILPELSSDPEFEERFIAEAKLTVGLSHANVVQVLDFGRFAGTLFIAMELVQGVDLAALLDFYGKADKKVPIPAAFQISIDLARGLAFAHENRVVHRDVSPSNILLSRAGEVKIADFGIATALREDPARDRGRVMGKWRYMSPEQTQGKVLTEASDMFSAAAVIFEVFSGKKLFQGDSSQDIIDNIHSMDLPLLSKIRPGVPPELDEILGHALQREVDKRTLGGSELIRALTEASYRSTLIATSVDIADAVAEALDAGVGSSVAHPPSAEPNHGGLDAMIRAQLAASGEGQVHRKTALDSDLGSADTEIQTKHQNERQTMVPSGVDGHGLTIWRLDAETVAAGPRALRETNAPAEEESDFRGLRRGIWLSALGFASLIGLMIWLVGQGPKKGAQNNLSELLPDGSVAAQVASEAILHCRSVPDGAEVFLDGELLATPSPVDAQVVPGKSHKVRFALAGYDDYEQSVQLEAGQRLNLTPVLRPKRAVLSVQTIPPGASVHLEGKLLGTTQSVPLLVQDLVPAKDQTLTIRKKGYAPIQKSITLGDEPLVIIETLRSTVVMGEFKLSIVTKVPGQDAPQESWADVLLNNKKLGTAPGTFRLPVGKHSLLFKNPASGKSKRKTIEVGTKSKTHIIRL